MDKKQESPHYHCYRTVSKLESKVEQLTDKLEKQQELTEIWKEKYLAENKKLMNLIDE